ncbi:MAG: hypothetical protein EHM41_15470 [Chloroflexi bacterium]|nr:MAG: hypothetical protein EHM41_15470 [Chloroflexota bacterium]
MKRFIYFLSIVFILTACFPADKVKPVNEEVHSQLSIHATPTAVLLETNVWQIPSSGLNIPTPVPIESLYKKVTESEHFVYYQDQGYQPVDLNYWMDQAEKVYGYVSQRLNIEAEEKIGLVFQEPDTSSCPSRGMTAGNFIILYADQQTGEKQLLGILAHEIGHAILISTEKLSRPATRGLDEGMATWAAGDYWTNWNGYPSFDAMIREYLEKSTYIPIYQDLDLIAAYQEPLETKLHSQVDCLVIRDILYTEWAAFLDYLLQQYGMEKLEAIFQSGGAEMTETEVINYPPDFYGIFGLAINQLEAEWLAWIR